ncbi:hypothetical protein JZ751_011053 [Albula glossodonta]|uniref:Uncharacterized protein n=1 Tax=Albula glossodonta TaxID=121402 RepID=A0A8T2NW73_9TELE|nr:hypothetical protein JZ751_011053 [Albula glossodonta]
MSSPLFWRKEWEAMESWCYSVNPASKRVIQPYYQVSFLLSLLFCNFTDPNAMSVEPLPWKWVHLLAVEVCVLERERALLVFASV